MRSAVRCKGPRVGSGGREFNSFFGPKKRYCSKPELFTAQPANSRTQLFKVHLSEALITNCSRARQVRPVDAAEHDRFAPLDAATTMATLTVRDMPSEMEDKILADCHRLNGGGVRELLMLRTVNKAFRRNVDQFVLTITPTIINGGFDFVRGLRAQDKKADLMQLMEIVVNWIALGCLSFVRVAEMRGESKSKMHVRSFMYTVAYQMADNSFN